MKRFIAAILITLMAAPISAADWSAHVKELKDSTVYIENVESNCTGFIIDNKRDYVLTAAHCMGDKLIIDGKPMTKLIVFDRKKDIMVVQVDGLDGPALKLAKKNPKVGEQLAAYGYGFGLDHPMLRIMYVSDDDTYIPTGGIGGPFIVTDSTFISGQSGGPVINEAGEIAMIIQMATAGVGIGIGAEMLEDKIGKYTEQPEK